MKDHRLIDKRSLAFHRRVAEKLRVEPSLRELARANLERWETSASTRLLPVLSEWRALLDAPGGELLAILTSEDARATRLRQSSPFAGALTPVERFAILREFQARDSLAT